MEGITYYTRPAYDVAGDTCRAITVPFFVKDDGLLAEEAYWGGSEPKPALVIQRFGSGTAGGQVTLIVEGECNPEVD